MNKVVLDFSAILALINGEPGSEKLPDELLARSVASAVNLAEVQTKLVKRGWPSAEAWDDATSPVREILPFDGEQAKITGDLVGQTRYLGLSLGDRACIALGLTLNLPVYTAEKLWKQVKAGVEIHIIR
jgi:ribonuclease VapC